jgi:hypothetical protein
VAQLVAHLHGMQGVRGSNPLSSTKKAQDSDTCDPAVGHLALSDPGVRAASQVAKRASKLVVAASEGC